MSKTNEELLKSFEEAGLSVTDALMAANVPVTTATLSAMLSIAIEGLLKVKTPAQIREGVELFLKLNDVLEKSKREPEKEGWTA